MTTPNTDWTMPDGSPLPKSEIANLAGALIDAGWRRDDIAASIGISRQRLNAIMQAADELLELKINAIGGPPLRLS